MSMNIRGVDKGNA